MRNFVVLEGLDGAGTTTQMKAAAERLGCFTTAEPTKDDTGRLLRRCLSGEIDVPKSTMAYLFAADRHEHVYGKGGIAEQAKKGIVLCDRYLYSSFAYQGDENLRRLVAELNGKFPVPELVVWLDVPPEVCVQRMSARDGRREIYENLEYLKGVHERYEAMFTGKTNLGFGRQNILRIDGTLPREVITDRIVSVIRDIQRTHDRSMGGR